MSLILINLKVLFFFKYEKGPVNNNIMKAIKIKNKD